MLLHDYNDEAVSHIKVNGYFQTRLWCCGNIVLRSLNVTITINSLKQYDILYINGFNIRKKKFL